MMAEDFDTILDRCLAHIATGDETIDSSLHRYPDQSGQLAILLTIAEQARAVPAPAPLSTNRRLALESRILQQARQLQAKPVRRATAPRLPVWRRGLAPLLASFVVLFLLLGSAVTVSASSVPGDVLYPIKRTAEQVRLTLATVQQQSELHLEFAQRRLEELRVLADRGDVSEELLAEISNETTAVLEQVPALPQDKQQTLLASLTDFQDQELQALETIALTTRGDAHTKVLAAVAESATKRKLAADLLAGAASGAADGSHQEPYPTAQASPTVTPEPTTSQATEVPSATPPKSTPPGLVDKPTPPGLVNKPTPPGLVDKPTPPGLVNKPTPHAPPEKPTKVHKK